jgi:hypothetical protein
MRGSVTVPMPRDKVVKSVLTAVTLQLILYDSGCTSMTTWILPLTNLKLKTD